MTVTPQWACGLNKGLTCDSIMACSCQHGLDVRDTTVLVGSHACSECWSVAVFRTLYMTVFFGQEGASTSGCVTSTGYDSTLASKQTGRCLLNACHMRIVINLGCGYLCEMVICHGQNLNAQ